MIAAKGVRAALVRLLSGCSSGDWLASGDLARWVGSWGEAATAGASAATETEALEAMIARAAYLDTSSPTGTGNSSCSSGKWWCLQVTSTVIMCGAQA